MKRFFFTVTNDLTYDQRMIRICTSLANEGYLVTLVGRKLRSSKPLQSQAFCQKRIKCFFKKGKIFYAEYNIRLFFYLLFKKMDLICAIDLDTILPCYFISKIKRIIRVYDAHELFCEMKEIVSRPSVHAIWKRIEKFAVPKFKYGYTVNQLIADEFRTMYSVDYAVIRSVPVLRPLNIPEKKEKYILYQGAVNEGRSFETLIPAMKLINARLIIAGEGNFISRAKELMEKNVSEDKIIFTGNLLPDELYNYTVNAWIGITLFEKKGLSNYFSLANRFFDYINAGIPQLCVDYPAYKEINKIYNIAVLINDLGSESIAGSVNRLLDDEALYFELQKNCLTARKELNWQNEEKKLINFYNNLFTS
jgi:glycosyltransferase involved in cell wall biosynthesis